MLSSLLRPRNKRRRSDRSPYSTPFNSSPLAVRAGNVDENENEEDENDEENDDYDEERSYNEDDEDDVDTPLLPIFSAAHLDKLPLYNITHSCRILIVQKCETTLSWDQLRSPQVSQFVVKPIQSQIRADHFNRATICALIANCLQFQKEAQLHPGNAGVSKTRAMISELLAMRLLKDFNTRELIDALSYDFDPLEGLSPVTSGIATPGGPKVQRQHGRGARVSTVEVAIRAQAKRFLAHGLVVQQLEAIWAGTIVFHSAADSLHRKPPKPEHRRSRGYGTIEPHSPSAAPADAVASKKVPNSNEQPVIRRSVTLYDTRDASLFKLSRLRVPRYRQFFSTISFAIMLGLFLAVLIDRSLEITPLEVVFWFWSAGYMLDEVVGFSEQGFGLYILSVWNALDLGILLLLFVYYVLRLYGVLVPAARKHTMANMAYDVLASNAILLFPRLFSVLDHYKYFSQLLIAFRLMAQDMVAILVLIVICCSGFFVAFTLSFSDDKTDGAKVAYALFQIIMGFSPAAWEFWAYYNILGKILLASFLIICHFLIVTILITVLTNSFMAVVQNANDEHQFLFAINTISMVKSDALFSYIPPTNLFGWVASPLRYLIPFRGFVRFNRTIIKVSHFPILFVIFSYERLILSRNAYEPTDLIERKGKKPRGRLPAFSSLNKSLGPFSPGVRLREPSVVSFHKDRALEEVFRRPYQDSTVRTARPGEDAGEGPKSLNVVNEWMQDAENEGGASPPMEQPRSIVERLENRRPGFRRAQTAAGLTPFRRDYSSATRSILSDPEDLQSNIYPRLTPRIDEETDMELSRGDAPQETDADGDDELVTNDDGDNATATETNKAPTDTPDDVTDAAKATPRDYFAGVDLPKLGYSAVPQATRARILDSEPKLPESAHQRQVSSSTAVFSPVIEQTAPSSPVESPRRKTSRPTTAKHTNSGGTSTPIPTNSGGQSSGRRTPKPFNSAKSRPILPGRNAQLTAPNIHWGTRNNHAQKHRQPSFNARALDLASEIGDNRYGPDPLSPGSFGGAGNGKGMLPASFSEQLLREQQLIREMERRREEQRRRSEEEEQGMVGRIMLSRMNTLEEGFREVLKEVKDMAYLAAANSSRAPSEVGVGRRVEAIRPATAPGNKNERPLSMNAAVGLGLGSGSAGVGVSEGSVQGASGTVRRKNPRKLQRRGTAAAAAMALGKGKEKEGEGRPLTPLTPGGEGISPMTLPASRDGEKKESKTAVDGEGKKENVPKDGAAEQK